MLDDDDDDVVYQCLHFVGFYSMMCLCSISKFSVQKRECPRIFNLYDLANKTVGEIQVVYEPLVLVFRMKSDY